MNLDDLKAISLDEQASRVRLAFYEEFTDDAGGEYMPMPYVMDVYTDYLICCQTDGTYWLVGYTLTSDAVTFTSMEQWQPVEREWVTAKGLDQMAFMGGAVKALGEGRVGGHLVLYGNPNEADFYGEYFTAKTDYDFEDGAKATVYYQHGFDDVLKRRKLGKGTMKRDDVGVWFEAQLNLRDEYEQSVYELAKQGKLGWSSGTAGHLVERKHVGRGIYEITAWPLGSDASLTPNPADWRNFAVPIKSLPFNTLPLTPEPEADEPEAAPAAVPAAKADVTIRVVVDQQDQMKHKTYEGGTIMPENIQTNDAQDAPVQDNAELKSRLGQLEAVSQATNDRIEKVLDILEAEAPARKGAVLVSLPNAPTKTQSSESLGDWFVSVRRAGGSGLKALEAEKRLAEVYGSVKSMDGDQGANGAFLVPEAYEPRFLTATQQASRIVNEVFKQPTTLPSGNMPVLDFTRTPTAGAGDVAMAGGLAFSSRAEGGSYTEAQAYFENVHYSVSSESLEVQAAIELVNDSPIAIENLLTRLFGTAMSARIERHILRGTGVGQPLGILNAPAAVGITPDTDNVFVLADAVEMDSRFLTLDGAKPFWIAHNSMKTDIGALQVGTYGPTYIQDVQRGTMEMSLLNYPVVYSQHLPQANSSGCVILADLNAYILFQLGGLSVFYSEHTRRTSGKVAWYVDYRIDGQPWLSGAVTDASPGGSFTTSPFVYFND